MSPKVYVLDTNIILQNIRNISEISDNGSNIVVIPETVLLELEDKKKLFNELGFQSREFARMLAKMKTKEVDFKKNYQVVKLALEDTEIHIIAKDSYKSEVSPYNIAESNDKRIIEVASVAKEYYKGLKVVFLSIDIYARTFAKLANIKTQTLQEDRSDIPEFAFVKSMELDSSCFNRLHLQNIREIDPDYACENFCYEFCSSDGNKAFAIVANGQLHVLDDKDFAHQSIKPVNLRQKYFVKAIMSNLYNLLVLDAKAGSGKTLMSIVSAMRLIDRGEYEKIVYVRNSIESLDKGADVGYLAGNDEKFRVYNMALYDTLEFIAKKKLKNANNKENKEALKAKSDELVNKYNIEMLWPGEARGRTLSGAVVIMDEWQNSSENTTQLILSRLDESCKAIVIGSNRQIDNLYLNRYNNGLTTLLKQTKQPHEEISLFAIELEKAVRGRFAEFSERIFENS